MAKKHYILKNNSNALREDYLCELDKEKRELATKKCNEKDRLLLIEKVTVKSKDGSTSEHYNNVWTIADGADCLIYDKTKNNLIFDYTGFVYPIIHINKKPMTWAQYQSIR